MGQGQCYDYKICQKCGALYINFCIHCEKRGIGERVWELMSRFGLNEEELIRILADQVHDGKFAALSLAIAMRDMKPAEKHEVDIEDGQKLNDAKRGIVNLLSKLAGRKRPE